MSGASVAPLGRRVDAVCRARAEEVKFCAADLKDAEQAGVFEGYASVFNRQDMGRDVVLPGAFRESLNKRRAEGVRMLFQHDPNQPIGVWERIYEDARGLFVRGRIMTEIEKGREVLALMRAGAIDGLSIGFRAEQGVRSKRTGVRRLAQIDLWEISVVTFPMMPDARVSAVKSSAPRGVPTTREFERWLTQDAGLSRSQARAVMRDGLKGLDPLRDAGESSAMRQILAEQIAEAAQLMRAGAASRSSAATPGGRSMRRRGRSGLQSCGRSRRASSRRSTGYGIGRHRGLPGCRLRSASCISMRPSIRV